MCVWECEELLKIVQRSRDSWLDLAGGSWLQATRMMHTCQACQKLKRYASCCTTGQNSQAGQAVCSQLELATHPSRQNTLFGKIWLFTFLLTLLYIYPYTHDLERASRKNFERENLEKTRLIHPQSSLKDSSNSSTLFLSIIKSLRGLLPKLFLTISISMKGLFGALGSS